MMLEYGVSVDNWYFWWKQTLQRPLQCCSVFRHCCLQRGSGACSSSLRKGILLSNIMENFKVRGLDQWLQYLAVKFLLVSSSF